MRAGGGRRSFDFGVQRLVCRSGCWLLYALPSTHITPIANHSPLTNLQEGALGVDFSASTYCAVSGHDDQPDHLRVILRLAERMLAVAAAHRYPDGRPLQVRVGVHMGAVTTGACVWGGGRRGALGWRCCGMARLAPHAYCNILSQHSAPIVQPRPAKHSCTPKSSLAPSPVSTCRPGGQQSSQVCAHG